MWYSKISEWLTRAIMWHPKEGEWFTFTPHTFNSGVRYVVKVHYYNGAVISLSCYAWRPADTRQKCFFVDNFQYVLSDIKPISAEEAEEIVAIMVLAGYQDPRVKIDVETQ